MVIVGGGGHGLATAYYLAKEHGITDVAVLERGWLAGGNITRNTTVIRSNYLWDESAAIYEHALKLWEGLEAELALVIGERASHAPEASAMDVIEAYTCANDVSARDYQFGDAQWFRGKNVDGFCPLGPSLVDAGDLDVSDLRVVQRLNGEVLQDARTSDLIFSIPVLISYVSTYITLEVGDLILTGTPEGVGLFRDPKISLTDGDVVEVEIDGIGVLRNGVRAAT